MEDYPASTDRGTQLDVHDLPLGMELKATVRRSVLPFGIYFSYFNLSGWIPRKSIPSSFTDRPEAGQPITCWLETTKRAELIGTLDPDRGAYLRSQHPKVVSPNTSS